MPTAATMTVPAPAALPGPAPAAKPAASGHGGEDSGFSFADLLDVINPLQHIPIVSTIYRAITHDTIKPAERIAGDTLYGGVIGFFSSVADTIFEAVTGKDIGSTVLSLLDGDKTPSSQSPQVATTAAPSAAPAAPLVAAAPAHATGMPRSIVPTALRSVPTPPAPSPQREQQPAPQLKPAPQKPATPQDSVPVAASQTPELAALMAALQDKGVSSDLGLRAAAAYRHAVSLSDDQDTEKNRGYRAL
ncbi:MAG: hypothetical protein J0H10_00935 [Alphaproteobacteria bacterium]|nr:hypothetical protein [Alphaproteobacteria bacterium]